MSDRDHDHTSIPEPELKKKDSVIPGSMLLSFCLVTTLFALWGFANDVTNPLVGVFKDLFQISNTQSSLVQTAFYGGYATMALPAAIFIRRFSYKAGILVGLGLYATGAMLVIPACAFSQFWFFLAALYVLTFGLAFLETTANPYILAMGPESTSTQRLNFAQAFNPMGSLTGMIVASQVVLASLGVQEFRNIETAEIQAAHKAAYQADLTEYRQDKQEFVAQIEQEEQRLEQIKQKLESLDKKSEEYKTLSETYKTGVAALRDRRMVLEGEYRPMLPGRVNKRVGAALEEFKQGDAEFIAPARNEQGEPITGPDGEPKLEKRFDSHAAMVEHDLGIVQIPYVTIGGIVIVMFLVFAITKLPQAGGHDRRIRFFETYGRLLKNGSYVGGVIAQTFYVGAQIMCWTFIIQYAAINLNMPYSEAQNYNIVAMIIFCSSRFICTYMLKYVSPGGLLMVLALGGIALTCGTIFIQGMTGLYCLVGISACMSLMFPTIYGIALKGLGEDAKLGSAGLIFAIVGGALMPPMQGSIIDMGDEITGMLDLGFMTLPAVSASFVLPLICFVVIALYGMLTHAAHRD